MFGFHTRAWWWDDGTMHLRVTLWHSIKPSIPIPTSYYAWVFTDRCFYIIEHPNVDNSYLCGGAPMLSFLYSFWNVGGIWWLTSFYVNYIENFTVANQTAYHSFWFWVFLHCHLIVYAHLGPSILLLDGSIFSPYDVLLFLCLSMWWTTTNPSFQMTYWESLDLLHKIEDQIIYFQK